MSIYADRVKLLTEDSGTGQLTIDEAVDGFQDLNEVFSNGDVFVYWIVGDDNGSDAQQWEHGIGSAVISEGDRIDRDRILSSSNGGTAINWTSGASKIIFIGPSGFIENEALKSFASSSRPSYLPAGSQWIDNSADPYVINYFDGTVDIPLFGVNASTGAADVPRESSGTWTPTITFATPGNLSVAYTTQDGVYYKQGSLVICSFNILTSTFTHTTASGNLRIGGLPFTVLNSTPRYHGSCSWQGITISGYTQMTPRAIGGTTYLRLMGSGSGVARSLVVAANMPTAGTVQISGSIMFPT